MEREKGGRGRKEGEKREEGEERRMERKKGKKEGEEAEGCHGQERSWDRSECTHGKVARVVSSIKSI